MWRRTVGTQPSARSTAFLPSFDDRYSRIARFLPRVVRRGQHASCIMHHACEVNQQQHVPTIAPFVPSSTQQTRTSTATHLVYTARSARNARPPWGVASHSASTRRLHSLSPCRCVTSDATNCCGTDRHRQGVKPTAPHCERALQRERRQTPETNLTDMGVVPKQERRRHVQHQVSAELGGCGAVRFHKVGGSHRYTKQPQHVRAHAVHKRFDEKGAVDIRVTASPEL